MIEIGDDRRQHGIIASVSFNPSASLRSMSDLISPSRSAASKAGTVRTLRMSGATSKRSRPLYSNVASRAHTPSMDGHEHGLRKWAAVPVRDRPSRIGAALTRRHKSTPGRSRQICGPDARGCIRPKISAAEYRLKNARNCSDVNTQGVLFACSSEALVSL